MLFNLLLILSVVGLITMMYVVSRKKPRQEHHSEIRRAHSYRNPDAEIAFV